MVADTAVACPKDQAWADLFEALAREAESMGGFGQVEITINFNHSLPRDMTVLQRRQHYRLGSGQAPLTGKASPVRMAKT